MLGERLRNKALQMIAAEFSELGVVDFYIKKYAIFLNNPDAYKDGTLAIHSSRDPETLRDGTSIPSPERAVDIDAITLEDALKQIDEADDEFFVDIHTLIQSYPYDEPDKKGYKNRKQGRYTRTNKKTQEGIPYRAKKREEDVAQIIANLEKIAEPLPEEDLSAPRRIYTAEQGKREVERVTREKAQELRQLREELSRAQAEAKSAQAALEQERSERAKSKEDLETVLTTSQANELKLRGVQEDLQRAQLEAQREKARAAALLEELSALTPGFMGGIKYKDIADIVKRHGGK